MSEPKRFRVKATIEFKGDITADEVRRFFLPLQQLGGAVTVKSAAAPEEDTEEAERRALLAARARNLAELYREKLGEGPNYLADSIERWLMEGFSDPVLRSAIVAVTKADDFAGMTRRDRYEELREVLRGMRMDGTK